MNKCKLLLLLHSSQNSIRLIQCLLNWFDIIKRNRVGKENFLAWFCERRVLY